MILQFSFLIQFAFSALNANDKSFSNILLNILLNDTPENLTDTNSTIESPPQKRKFPFVPVLVSSAFVIFVGILALIYLVKKLKARKNYRDLEAQEREVQLISHDEHQEMPKPLENQFEQNGIVAQAEEVKNEEVHDLEKKEENKQEEEKKEEEAPPEKDQNEEQKTDNIEEA